MHKLCLVFRLLNVMSQTKSDSTQHWSSETITDWSSNRYLEKLTCHYIAVDSCQMKNMGCCMSVDGFYCCGPSGQLRADLDLINDTIVSSIVRANYVSLFLFILSIILLSVVVCCIIDATHFRWSRKQEIQSAVKRKSKNRPATEVLGKGIAVDGQTRLQEEDKNSSDLICRGCSATTQGEMSAASWWQHDSNSVQALQTTAQVHSVPPDLLVSNASKENMTAVLPLIGPQKYMQYPVLYGRKHSLPTSSRNIYYTPISVQRNNSFTTISKDKPANVSHFVKDNNPSTSHFGSLVEDVPARKKRLPSKSSVDDNTSTTTTTTSTFSRKQLYSYGDLETLV